ncbi:hypothetical protein OROMI_000713 [Orobanche minor]
MVRSVRKRKGRSEEECSTRSKNPTGKSKRENSKKKSGVAAWRTFVFFVYATNFDITMIESVEHDPVTSSESEYEMNKNVGKHVCKKKRPRATPTDSSKPDSISTDCMECEDSSGSDSDIINEVLNASSTDYSSDSYDARGRLFGGRSRTGDVSGTGTGRGRLGFVPKTFLRRWVRSKYWGRL